MKLLLPFFFFLIRSMMGCNHPVWLSVTQKGGRKCLFKTVPSDTRMGYVNVRLKILMCHYQLNGNIFFFSWDIYLSLFSVQILHIKEEKQNFAQVSFLETSGDRGAGICYTFLIYLCSWISWWPASGVATLNSFWV